MASARAGSGVAAGFGVAIAVVALLLTIPCVAILADLKGSDAAGNAIAEALAALWLVALFVGLGSLAMLAMLVGDMPGAHKAATLGLGLVWGLATWGVFAWMSGPPTPAGRWPLAIVGLGPPFLVAICLWALVAPLRAAVPTAAAGAALGALALVCLAYLPLAVVHDDAMQREAARVDDWQARLAATPADSPLWRWTPFLDSGVYRVEEDAREAMRKLPSRQADAEAMLERDELDFGLIQALDLDPTPSLCDKARAALMRRAARLTPAPGGNHPYAEVARQVGAATEGMKWLVGFGCPCEAESRAWEALARAWGGTDFAVYELPRLRDTKELGRILNSYPPKFSMLTPQASLKAWLNFADPMGGTNPHAAEALEGARKLGHRSADAVAWLTDPNERESRAFLMRHLMQLDLEATPELCRAGLAWVDDEFAAVYRPPPDHPPPYTELVERLGAGHPLMAVQWFALQGCDADKQLAAAESLIFAYGEAPQRADILAALARLRRKP